MSEPQLVDPIITELSSEYSISAPEVIWQIGSFPVTNSLITSLLFTFYLSIIAIFVSSRISMMPGRIQALFEVLFEAVFNMTEKMAAKNVYAYFPWLMTFVVFILFSNLSALLPGFASIGLYRKVADEQVFVPLFRSINSDLNVTLSLALISVFITHFFAIRSLGIVAYLKKWFSFKMFGISLFVGLLELAAEFTKIISLSFRLFGNIMAGKILLKTAKSFFPFILPLPFYFLEIMVAFIQSAVFVMLTLVFMVALSKKEED
jgi:F-type H+-transporting ATPase subunit a